MAKYELYGTPSCPYTCELREWLEWKRCEFVEYDVDSDQWARERMNRLTGNQRNVPVLVENGTLLQIGWQGRSCILGTWPE